MKLLLTSGGITNASIREALVDLLGKPIDECRALCIPTAQWGHPMCGPRSVRDVVVGEPQLVKSTPQWESVGVLELTALPSIDEARWIPWVRDVDVLLVDGGDATYLCHWMRESGLANLLPSLVGGPAYVIDDQTAIMVTDGNVEVVSEGQWELFPR